MIIKTLYERELARLCTRPQPASHSEAKLSDRVKCATAGLNSSALYWDVLPMEGGVLTIQVFFKHRRPLCTPARLSDETVIIT